MDALVARWDKFRCYQCDRELGNRWDLQNHLNWTHSTGLRYRVDDEGLLLNTGDEINDEFEGSDSESPRPQGVAETVWKVRNCHTVPAQGIQKNAFIFLYWF